MNFKILNTAQPVTAAYAENLSNVTLFPVGTFDSFFAKTTGVVR